jgi:anti-anti-sigma factor
MLSSPSGTAAKLAVYGAAPGTPSAALTCSQTRGVHDEALLHLEGELDVATAPRLQRTLQAAQEATPHVVVDLRDVTFIGIAGVRAITAASDRARRAGQRLAVVNGTHAARVFALTGLWDDVEFCDADASRAGTPAAVAGAGRCARHGLPNPSLSKGGRRARTT